MVKERMDPEIEELTRQLTDLCRKKGAPMFFSVYDREKKGYVYRTLLPSELGITIPNDKFPAFIRAVVGFDFENYKDD